MSGPVKRDAFIQNVTTSLPVPTNGPLLHVLTMVYIRIISKPKKNITPECLWIALAYPNISVFASLFRLVFLTHTSVEKGREPYCTLDIELLHISKTKKRKGRVSWSLMHFTKNESMIELLDIAKTKPDWTSSVLKFKIFQGTILLWDNFSKLSKDLVDDHEKRREGPWKTSEDHEK